MNFTKAIESFKILFKYKTLYVYMHVFVCILCIRCHSGTLNNFPNTEIE